MMFDIEPKPMEIPPDKSIEHSCAVDKIEFGFAIESDELWRPVGTCWRCPDCWQWWIAKQFGMDRDGSVRWERVRRFSRAWFRCRRFEKTYR